MSTLTLKWEREAKAKIAAAKKKAPKTKAKKEETK
tara:strand:+ start:139 stop:243 length:105 start_codon:yes stop_codon:yes gene_type:complete